jgi:gliding motility-associated-like protein
LQFVVFLYIILLLILNKMKKYLFAFFLLTSLYSFASHIAGGQITYKCLGNNLFQVKLTYFWDCAGGFNPGTSQIINVNGCGQALSLTVNQSSLTPGDGVMAAGLCPTASTLVTCKKRIEYLGTITLPSACNSWSFSIGSCCRSSNIINQTPVSQNYYHQATLNNLAAPCNNSADISIDDLPNFCVNQPACFNLGATEIDGHTLTYSLVSSFDSNGIPNTYAAPYTGAAPIVGITINSTTGQVNFTPVTQGDFVINVLITETDALGNVVGTIMRDFQAIVTNCNNQTVSCGQGNITNVTSGTVPAGSANTLQICENVPFCFDVTFTDPDLTDSIKITSPNMSTTLPGSSMVLTYTPGITNKVKAHICWTPPSGSSGLNTSFVLIVKDNACPVPGTQVLNYFIDVLSATSAGPDKTICGTQAASITATGSSTVFAWTNLAGTTIPTGPAFSCNPCNNPVIKPAVTSTYVVTNIGGGANCKNKDTLVIHVAPDFTLSANVLASSGCLNSAVQFTSNVTPAGAYTYTWSPSAPLTTTNTANTSATYSTAGTYNYTLTAVSSMGCTKQNSNISFVANPVVSPIFTVVPTNTTICANSNVPLTVNFGSAPPTSCGLSTTGCFSPNQIAVGNGATGNTSTSSPAPYGNYDKNRREQYLFTAAELIAAGLVPGNISSISFPVNSIQPVNTTSTSSSATYIGTLPNYSIKMKCTSATSLADFDNVGLTQVYFGNFTPIVGLNTHNLPQAYSWDGSSSILIDICYTRNLPLASEYYTSNPVTPYTNTGVVKTVYYSADGTPACGNANGTTSTNRPNIKFGNCSSTPNPNSFSYSWLPTTGLNNPAIQSPTTNVSSSIIYTVVVTPTAAVTCSNVGTTNLTVTIPTTPTITPVSAMCSNASTLNLVGSPAGGTWSLTAATSTTGVFTPSLASVGNNTVTYTYGGVGCLQSTTAIVPVEKYVPSTITGAINPLCVTNSAVNLSTSLTTSTLGVGVWAGNGVTGTTFNPSTAGPGTHTITYSTNSSPTTTLCPSTSSLVISVSSLTQPTLTPAGPYCDNFAVQSMTVTPTVASGATWSSTTSPTAISSTGQFNPAAATLGSSTITYSVVNGPCTASTSINVNVVHFIPATITGTAGPFCIYNPLVNLQATAQYTGGVWSGNGVTGTDFTPALAGAGTHTVTYKTDPAPSGLCPDSMKLSILVNAKPQANALSNVLQGCNPLIVNLYSSTVNTGNANWNFGDGSPLGNGLAISHTYSVPGVYTASISYTDAIGCVNDSSVANSFTVFANPVASFEASLIQTTVVDGQIDFTNHSTILNNNTYSWDIGGLSTSTQTNTSYLFTNSGNYVITLTATSADNCVDDTSIVVIINPDVVLYVPNAFTPSDGNGLNDVFQIFLPPTGVDYSTFNLQIFDRWGEMVYSTNDVTKSWNGAKNNVGPLLKQDTYVWKISFLDEKKKEYNKIGHITILSK